MLTSACLTGMQALLLASPPYIYRFVHKCFIEKKPNLSTVIQKCVLTLALGDRELKNAEASNMHPDTLEPLKFAIQGLQQMVDDSKKTDCVQYFRIADGTTIEELNALNANANSEILALRASSQADAHKGCHCAASTDESSLASRCSSGSSGAIQHRSRGVRLPPLSLLRLEDTFYSPREQGISLTARF